MTCKHEWTHEKEKGRYKCIWCSTYMSEVVYENILKSENPIGYAKTSYEPSYHKFTTKERIITHVILMINRFINRLCKD